MKKDKIDKKLVVLGIFKNPADANIAVDNFKNSGFRSADISALFPKGDQTKEFAHVKSTKLPEEALKGGATGAVLGGALGWLAGVGSIAIPGVGPFIAAGPIMGMLAGASVAGTIGAIAGSLIGLGIPEYEAKRFEGRIKEGGILVSVHCDDNDWKEKAKKIFEDSGATDISSTNEEEVDADRNHLNKSGYASNY